jgi:hypothetical protein
MAANAGDNTVELRADGAELDIYPGVSPGRRPRHRIQSRQP